MHKFSVSKSNLGQIAQSKRTRKELETAHVKPLRAALGFHRILLMSQSKAEVNFPENNLHTSRSNFKYHSVFLALYDVFNIKFIIVY